MHAYEHSGWLSEYHVDRHSGRRSEMDQQQEQYENLKWKLERKLRELDGELALQRQVEPCWGLVLP